MKPLFSRVVIACAVLSGACTMNNQEAPPLTGPSELGLSIAVTASPDVLPLDGGSRSLITITALDFNSQPVRNLSLRAGIRYGLTVVDFGSLSARNLVTDAQGRATLTYTAPASSASGEADTGASVSIFVEPIGTNYLNTIERFVQIRLIPPGVVIPGDGLVGRFTYTPESPVEGDAVLFDASTSAANPLSPITSYSWSFGDGSTASGRTATHAFSSAGFYAVTLTVGDAYGRSSSTTQSVTVGAGAAPTAAFVFSPSSPLPGQTVNFNGQPSTAAPGRTIVRYDWDFGDGDGASGSQVTHAYAASGTYTVVLLVTDSAGKTNTQAVTVTIGSDAPTADFVFSPTTVTTATTVNFNASASRAISGRTIASYQWDFGDGRFGSGITATNRFTAAGAYSVILTITDSAGATATVAKTITVQ
jgi:PKD repeat protein